MERRKAGVHPKMRVQGDTRPPENETSVHYFTLLVIIVLIYCSINIDKTTQKYNPIKYPSYTLKGSTF